MVCAWVCSAVHCWWEIDVQIKMKFEGIEKVQKQLTMLSTTGSKDAFSKAINDAAYQVKRVMASEMNTVFHMVTPYVQKSIWIKQATPDALSATIEPTYYGGKGIDPQKILSAQEAGGRRKDKRVESALRRVGILPNGYQTVLPKEPLPGSDDGRGNFRGAFITQLISYFAAFGEQGYRANMTDKRKVKLANVGASENGYRTIGGFVYFVSYGRSRGSHLAPGIWAKSGIHGSKIRPVMMFTRAGNYPKRFGMDRIARVADVDNYLSKRLRYRIRQAAEALAA